MLSHGPGCPIGCCHSPNDRERQSLPVRERHRPSLPVPPACFHRPMLPVITASTQGPALISIADQPAWLQGFLGKIEREGEHFDSGREFREDPRPRAGVTVKTLPGSNWTARPSNLRARGSRQRSVMAPPRQTRPEPQIPRTMSSLPGFQVSEVQQCNIPLWERG